MHGVTFQMHWSPVWMAAWRKLKEVLETLTTGTILPNRPILAAASQLVGRPWGGPTSHISREYLHQEKCHDKTSGRVQGSPRLQVHRSSWRATVRPRGGGSNFALSWTALAVGLWCTQLGDQTTIGLERGFRIIVHAQ
jgi:hypothetical protein